MIIQTDNGDVYVTNLSISYTDKTISYKTREGYTALTESWANFNKEQAEMYFSKKVKEMLK